MTVEPVRRYGGPAEGEDAMAENKSVDPIGGDEATTSRLPAPLEDRRPAVRPSAVAPADRTDALVRAVTAAPVAAAAIAGATVAVAATGAAAVSRLLWPWLVGRPMAPGGSSSTSPGGPGVYLSYTHIEVRWPPGR
jgi:hypothetical protein